MRKEWPVKWHSNPGQRRRFALKPRTKLTVTWAGHSEATAARSASPKTPAISARNTGLPSCVVARYGVYGQRLRYRWYSLDRKRRRSAVGHRRLVFSSMAPWNSGITLNSLAHRRRPRVPRRRRTDSCELDAALLFCQRSDHRLPLQGEPPLGVGVCLPWAPLLHLNPGRISAFSPFGVSVQQSGIKSAMALQLKTGKDFRINNRLSGV